LLRRTRAAITTAAALTALGARRPGLFLFGLRLGATAVTAFAGLGHGGRSHQQGQGGAGQQDLFHSQSPARPRSAASAIVSTDLPDATSNLNGS
jgi:hypothetical protein